MKNLSTTPVAAALAMALMAGIAACGKTDQTAGQKLDTAVAATERKADEAKADMKQGANDVKAAAADATKAVKQVVSDATITTGINAELAKDSALSMLKINVDSKDGHVQLNGTAPDLSAKERATTLAAGVSGVVSVDNHLTIK